jgi:hypothetical protein
VVSETLTEECRADVLGVRTLAAMVVLKASLLPMIPMAVRPVGILDERTTVTHPRPGRGVARKRRTSARDDSD